MQKEEDSQGTLPADSKYFSTHCLSPEMKYFRRENEAESRGEILTSGHLRKGGACVQGDHIMILWKMHRCLCVWAPWPFWMLYFSEASPALVLCPLQDLAFFWSARLRWSYVVATVDRNPAAEYLHQKFVGERVMLYWCWNILMIFPSAIGDYQC